jgi:hypothetical protein
VGLFGVAFGGCEHAAVEEFDLLVRRLTYDLFVQRGSLPSTREIAQHVQAADAAVAASWRRLHDAHALVLNPATFEIRMLNPFSAVPTAYRVHAEERWWYANCAWDAFGICASLGGDGRIHTSCPDCITPIDIDVVREQPSDTSLVFHCLVPAAHWWDDIVFT